MDRPWHAIVCSTLARHLRVPPARFRLAQRLREDWNLQPLGLVSVALELEDVESIDVPIAGLSTVHTVGDLVALARESSRRSSCCSPVDVSLSRPKARAQHGVGVEG